MAQSSGAGLYGRRAVPLRTPAVAVAVARAPLRVRVLGTFDVDGIETVGSRKARRLLKVLAIARGTPVPAERLARCLWDGGEPTHSAREVSVLVSRLRGVIGASRIVRDDTGYSLAADWLDLTAAIDHAQLAASRLSARDYVAALEGATSGLALFRGPLLAEEGDSDWVESHRVAAARVESHLRLTAALAALAEGDLELAAETAEALMEREPFDERGLRLVMVALSRAGRPAQALTLYSRFSSDLWAKFHLRPSSGSEGLSAAISRGEPLPDLLGPSDDGTPEVSTAAPFAVSALGDAAMTLRAAAVIGRTLDLELLAATLGLPLASVLRHVESGMERGIIVDDGPTLAFREDAVRGALAASMPEPYRAFLTGAASRARRSLQTGCNTGVQ